MKGLEAGIYFETTGTEYGINKNSHKDLKRRGDYWQLATTDNFYPSLRAARVDIKRRLFEIVNADYKKLFSVQMILAAPRAMTLWEIRRSPCDYLPELEALNVGEYIERDCITTRRDL